MRECLQSKKIKIYIWSSPTDNNWCHVLVVIDWFGSLNVSLIVAICDLIVRWLVQALMGCKMSMIALTFSQEGDILGSFYNSISILRLNARVLCSSMKVTRLRNEEGREHSFTFISRHSRSAISRIIHPFWPYQPTAPPPSVLLVSSRPDSCNIKSTFHISTGRMV